MAQEARTQGRSIVSVDWLRQHIDDPDVVVLCASMGNPIRSHQVAIPGAIVADLESDFPMPAIHYRILHHRTRLQSSKMWGFLILRPWWSMTVMA